MRKKLALVGVGGVVGTLLLASPAAAQDELSADVVQTALDNVWVLVAAVLVIFMQAGFALLEAGGTRAKNVGNIVMKNLMDFMVGVIAFFAVGFALAFGEGNDIIGWKGFFLEGGDFDFGTITLPTYFVFQVAFAATAATITSGAMAERTKFRSYLIYSAAITAFIYPVVVHWVWGGGWLSQRETPFVDFAGSTIVHGVGGWAALMGAFFLGPRLGKYGADGKARAILGHSTPFVVLGTLILLVGWYGFNPGSQLAADPVIGKIALTTTLAAAAGAVTSMILEWIKTGKPQVSMTCNGVIAGLVAITAGCAAVDAWAALLIGAVAGIVVVLSVSFFDKVKIDDPIAAISVHGVAGAWGTIAVGLVGSEALVGENYGLFLGGGADLLVTQIIGVVSVFVFVVVTAGALFAALKYTIGLRVSEEEEIMGLDAREHGLTGYADFVLHEGQVGDEVAEPVLT